MKIGYLINYSGAGGSEKYVKIMAQAARKVGHQVVFIYHLDGPLREHMEKEGYPIFYLNMRNPFDFLAAKSLAKLCKQEGIDLLHVQFPRENYIALLAKHFYKRLQVVYTCHLLYPKSPVWNRLNRVMTRGNKAVIAVCHAVERLLIANGVDKGKIQVVHNAIALTEIPITTDVRAVHGLEKEDFLCVILGRYTPEKGLAFLVDIFIGLVGQAKCIIVGDGPEFDNISEKIQANHLENTVLQVGYRTNVNDYLAGANLALNTSNSEALSFAILEGMAKGLPTVATDIGGNGELLRLFEPCGEIVPYGDCEAYAQAILKLKSDRARYEEYSKNAVTCVENHFNFDKMISDTLKNYTNEEK